MDIQIKKCDLCGLEHRSDENVKRSWADAIGKCIFNFKAQAGVQTLIEHDLCTKCASSIRDQIVVVIDQLKKGK